MYLGKINCPDLDDDGNPIYYFNVSVTAKCCQYFVVKKAATYDDHGVVQPGVVGLVYFKSQEYIPRSLENCASILELAYKSLFGKTGDFYGWFLSQVKAL